MKKRERYLKSGEEIGTLRKDVTSDIYACRKSTDTSKEEMVLAIWENRY